MCKKILFYLQIVGLCLAQTLLHNTNKNVDSKCLSDPEIKTNLITECVLECQRKQLHPIHKEDECFCVANECLFDEEELDTVQVPVVKQVENISKYVL